MRPIGFTRQTKFLRAALIAYVATGCVFSFLAIENHFALLRRCPDKERMRGIVAKLGGFADRQVVRMFLMRLHARLRALRGAQCPFVGEFLERIPANLLPRGWGAA